jgi:L-amino acid N-acyltransferase
VTPIVVRDAVDDDLPAITELQNALLATTAIEWTDEPHTVDERRAWLARHHEVRYPVIVADDGDGPVGWASFGDFRDIVRWPGYRFTVELTIHVRQSHWGTGVGRALMAELIDRARLRGKHVLVAAIDGTNESSVRFHLRLGFEEVGRMSEVGAKHGRWLDLVLLQLRLDDRPAPPG